MNSDSKKLIVFFAIIVGVILCAIVIPGALESLGDNYTLEPPNLYELTRQTAANTRWIFWVLVVGVFELAGLSAFVMTRFK